MAQPRSQQALPRLDYGVLRDADALGVALDELPDTEPRTRGHRGKIIRVQNRLTTLMPRDAYPPTLT